MNEYILFSKFIPYLKGYHGVLLGWFFFSILVLVVLFALIYPLSHKKAPTHTLASSCKYIWLHFLVIDLVLWFELFMDLQFPGLPDAKWISQLLFM